MNDRYKYFCLLSVLYVFIGYFSTPEYAGIAVYHVTSRWVTVLLMHYMQHWVPVKYVRNF